MNIQDKFATIPDSARVSICWPGAEFICDAGEIKTVFARFERSMAESSAPEVEVRDVGSAVVISNDESPKPEAPFQSHRVATSAESSVDSLTLDSLYDIALERGLFADGWQSEGIAKWNALHVVLLRTPPAMPPDTLTSNETEGLGSQIEPRG